MPLLYFQATGRLAVKTLVCVDGQDNALKAVRLAGEFACTTSGEATFLFVERHRTHTPRRNIAASKTIDMSALQWKQVPEMKYLLEAERVFKETREWEKHEPEPVGSYTALIQIGDGVFEVGKVQPRSDSGVHLRTRVGIPQEEILAELDDGRYDLVMLGAHRMAGCPWSEIENGPLYVAQKARCPVMVIGKDFEQGQPLLVCVGEKDPSESIMEMVRVTATRMKTDINVLTVLRSPDRGFQFSSEVSSMMDKWSARGLKVTPQVVIGDPVTVVLETAPDYGLTIFSFGKKHKQGRLGKVAKSVLCSQLNLLVAR
jgi:nucleotide-binding universal stress UspA family protein